MKLSILIPTYRRPKNVEQTVRSILNLFTAAPFNWEVIVSNNVLPDTQEPAKLSLEANSRVKVFTPKSHLLSAEENFKHGLAFCSGEFVWLLGDDDILVPAGVRCLIEEISRGQFDLLITGFKVIAHDGQLVSQFGQASHQIVLNIPFLDYVKRTGFWSVLAGFSTVVFHREKLDLNLFEKLMGISKIYSHTSTFIGSFYDKKFKFLNVATVEYRQNKTDKIGSEHWKKAAKSQGVKSKHFWVQGFIGHLELLIARGVFDYKFLSEVIDLAIGRRFRFLDHLVSHCLEQVRIGIEQDSERPTDSEFEKIVSFLEKVAPEYYDLWIYLNCLKQEQDTLKSKELIKQINFWQAQQGGKNHHWLDSFQFAVSGNYNIALHDSTFYAYDRFNHTAVNEILASFDIGEVKPFLLIADSLEEIVSKILATEKEIQLNQFNAMAHSRLIGSSLEKLCTTLLQRQEAHFIRSSSWQILEPLKGLKKLLVSAMSRTRKFLARK